MTGLIKKYKGIPIVARSALWFVICSFLQKAISLLTTPLFTRIFSTDEYGSFSIYNSWLEIISILATFKLSEAVFNKSLTVDKEHKEVLTAYQSISSIIWLIAFVLYLPFHTIIDSYVELPFSFMIIMFFEIYFQNSIRLWTAYERYIYKYRLLIIVTLLLSIFNPVLGLLLIRSFSNKVLARLLGIIIATGAIGLIITIYNFQSFSVLKIKQYFAYALKFNIVLIPHYLSQILLGQADRIMIGKYVGESAVALYSVAYTVGMLATMVTQSINNAYVPWMYRKIKNQEFRNIDKYNQKILLLVAVIILMVFLVAPEIVLVLGGTKYTESINVVYPVAASVYFIFVYSLYANIELYYEKRVYVSIGTIGSAILNLLLNYIFIKEYGYIAAAYTTLFCYISYGGFHLWASKRALKEQNAKTRIRIDTAIFAGISLIVMSFVCQMLINYIVIRYILLLAICLFTIMFRKKLLGFISDVRN